jgi:hypothetical protein
MLLLEYADAPRIGVQLNVSLLFARETRATVQEVAWQSS